MRVPVQLDGTAVLSSGKVGDVTLDLPEVAFALPAGKSSPEVPEPSALRLSTEGDLPTFVHGLILERGGARHPFQFEAKIGEEYLEGGWALETPEGSGHWAFTWPWNDAQRAKISGARVDVALWLNARHLFRSSQRFVEAIMDIRNTVGPSAVLWAPRIGLPENLAILHLMGIDLLDTTEGLLRAGRGAWIFPEFDSEEDLPPQPPLCGCAACQPSSDPVKAPGEEGERIRNRAIHAHHQYLLEERRVRHMIRGRRLRELVETRIGSHPFQAEVLRWWDSLGRDYVESQTTVVGEGTHPYVYAESHRRPEVERYRRRFTETYVPPRTKSVLVLVPCSFTKPYRNSPTHRAMARALSVAPSPSLIHLVSVTSPLGVVPAELEDIYPARNYDLPVTGEWSGPERSWVTDAVRRLQRSGRYARIAVHLSDEEYGWLKEVLPPSDSCEWTVVGDSSTSPKSLMHLSQFAGSLPSGNAPSGPGLLEEARSVLTFQFSQAIADRLIDGGSRLQGLPWMHRLVSSKGEILATWKENRGTWHLTVPGAEKVLDLAGDYSVIVNPDVELRGDLFAPGARSAGKSVREGSEAILTTGDRVVGVGESLVPGPWFGRLRRGMVVAVRKHGRKA